MRRALAAAAIVMLVPGTSAAQDTVRGGVTFARAPVLEPGVHRDTIRPGETLFYAVEVGDGMFFKVRANLRTRAHVQPLATRLRVYNGQRVEDRLAQDAGFIRPPGALGLLARSGRVGPPSVDFPDPGTQYFSVSVGGPGGRVGAELGLFLGIQVKPPPERDVPVVLEEPLPRDRPEPSRTGTYVLAALVGALLGGLGALVLSKLRQPPGRLQRSL